MSARICFDRRIKPELLKIKKPGELINLVTKGKAFNNYNDNFTDAEGNKISSSDFIIQLYSIAKKEGYNPQDIKNTIYFFLLGADKKYIIPENYKYVEVNKKLLSGKTTKVKVELSRVTALDIALTDIIGAYESNFEITTTKKENKIFLEIKRKNSPISQEEAEKLNLI